MIWIIIAIGIYKCGVEDGLHKEYDDSSPTEKASEDNIKSETHQDKEEPERLAFDHDIRVLIKTKDFGSIFHQELKISSSDGLEVKINDEKADYAPGEEYCINASDLEDSSAVIRSKNNGKMRLDGIARSEGIEYRGTIEAYGTKDGIVVVNELPVEEYLYGVVPSEMPSSYPMEAQKAQAIGARTYAYFHKKEYAYPEWRAHVDDSTTFQVYLNIPETEAAREAVDATENMVICRDGEPIQSYYYSTSGGYSAGNGAWSTGTYNEPDDDFLVETGEEIFTKNDDDSEQKYKAYIDSGCSSDIEYGEPWYRWEYIKVIDDSARQELFKRLYDMYLSQPDNVRIRAKFLSADKIVEETQINDIRVLIRQKSGLVPNLLIETPNFTVNIRTQNSIRQALSFAGDTVTKNDGSQFTLGNILPSAYFYIEKKFDNSAENGNNLIEIRIRGAGMGHGAGMSQNGAKCLALKGFTALQILAYYYRGSIEEL